MTDKESESKEQRRYREAFEVLWGITDGPLTPFQLRFFLSQCTRHPVSPSTLRTWRQRIGISPDNGRYGRAEVQHLIAYLSAKSEGKTTNQFNSEHISR